MSAVTSTRPRVPASVILIILLGACLPAGVRAARPAWDPVDPAELAEQQPKVDPEAGAEILLREAVYDHRVAGDLVVEQHYRIKVFSKAGIDELAKIEIHYDPWHKVRNIMARTIKADGTIVELNPKDIFDRAYYTYGRYGWRTKSFAPPAVEAGSIVEYRYAIEPDVSYWWWLDLSLEIEMQSWLPTRKVIVRYAPVAVGLGDGFLRTMYIHFPEKMGEKHADKKGFMTYELANLPAAKEEPFEAPFASTRTTLIFYYTGKDTPAPAVFWRDRAQEIFKAQQEAMPPVRSLRAQTLALFQPTDTDEEKLRKIYNFCVGQIKNRDRKGSGFTQKQIEKFPANSYASDVLKHGNGTSADINLLFTAMAQAAGFDARTVKCNDRSKILFDDTVPEDFMIPNSAVAVKLGANWRFFDPGATFLPFGALHWRNSNTMVLIADAKNGAPGAGFVDDAYNNVTHHEAKLTLAPDGSVDGDVTILFGGQRQAELKQQFDNQTDEEIEKFFKDGAEERLKQAEVTDVKVQNAKDPLGPLKVSYHVHVAEYADRTGSRLFFQPAFFQKNLASVFQAPKRRGDIFFHYPSIEQDEVSWNVPADWECEAGSAPGETNLGPLGVHDCEIFYSRSRHLLVWKRNLTLTALYAPRKAYEVVRKVFDNIHARDSHTLTFRRIDPSPSEPQPATSAPSPGAAAPKESAP